MGVARAVMGTGTVENRRARLAWMSKRGRFEPRIERIFTNRERLRRRKRFLFLFVSIRDMRGSNIQRPSIQAGRTGRAGRAHMLALRLRISDVIDRDLPQRPRQGALRH